VYFLLFLDYSWRTLRSVSHQWLICGDNENSRTLRLLCDTLFSNYGTADIFLVSGEGDAAFEYHYWSYFGVYIGSAWMAVLVVMAAKNFIWKNNVFLKRDSVDSLLTYAAFLVVWTAMSVVTHGLVPLVELGSPRYLHRIPYNIVHSVSNPAGFLLELGVSVVEIAVGTALVVGTKRALGLIQRIRKTDERGSAGKDVPRAS